MARQGVLKEGGRFGSTEFARPMARDPAMLHSGMMRAVPFIRKRDEPADGQLERNVGNVLANPLYQKPKEKPEFTHKTELALRAACAQCLGYYPTPAPCNAEIKLILKEMERMHGGWRKGFEIMGVGFGDMERTISEIARYARKKDLLPAERH